MATATNFDINSIVSQLMAVERRPLARLDNREAGYQAQLSAYGSVKGALASFQTAVQGLNSANKFTSLSATSSDDAALSANASSIAVAGTYSLEVTNLAQSQKLVATGQASSTASIGTGAETTVTFDFGTISGGVYTAYDPDTGTGGTYAGSTFTSNGNGSKSITIDSSNNSLQGIRDTINAAKLGVTASIINDGSGTPYRLVLSSDSNGASNSLNISVSGDAALSGLLTNNPGEIAAVAGSNTVAGNPKVAALDAGATAGTIAAGTLIANTSAGAISIGAVTLGTNAKTNGDAIALAINTALAAADGGFLVNGTAVADANGKITINAGSSDITLSMGGYAADSATATANQAALSAQTGFDASQLGTQAIGTQSMAQSVTAQNAVLLVNGVEVSKTSNSVSDVIQGVTLNLKKITSSPATLTVAHDKTSVTNAVGGFVKAYNDLAKTLKEISAYDPATKQAAILQGDSTVRMLQTQLRNALGSSIVGASGGLTTLSQIGISFQKDGSLTLDSAKLNSAMTSNPNDIANLFAATGRATDSLVSFTSAASSTKAGSYAVNITKLATQGNIAGTQVPNTVIDDSNKTLDITVDGVSASITLATGSYTVQMLAAELQAKINGANALSNAGISVAVTKGVDDKLTVTSPSFGSASKVTISGTGAADLLGAIPASTDGLDVAGTIGGMAATGTGQVLKDEQGLSITISGGALGERGSVNYSNGYAFLLDKWAGSILTTDGAIASRTKGINNSIKDLSSRRTALETRFVAIEKRYREQFTQLDVMLSSMNQTSTYLTQQLAQLSNLK